MRNQFTKFAESEHLNLRQTAKVKPKSSQQISKYSKAH